MFVVNDVVSSQVERYQVVVHQLGLCEVVQPARFKPSCVFELVDSFPVRFLTTKT